MLVTHSIIRRPSGLRRLSASMLSVRDRADRFQGVARGAGKPLRFLAAFQEAEPYLKLPRLAYKLVAWLIKQTMPHDWEVGSRPICWPSASRQAEFLDLSLARVKVLNRTLFEAGVFAIRDSETGKRYGRRDGEGRIVEAYGFDLSPLAYRYEEFLTIAAEARIAREKLRALRKRAARSRRAIRQISEMSPETSAEMGLQVDALVARASAARDADDLTPIVEALEALQALGEQRIRAAFPLVESNPQGLDSAPLTISTNKSLDLEDTVQRIQTSSEDSTSAVTPDELLTLAPSLALFVVAPAPDWSEIVSAAGSMLRRELGVSQPLWGEACRALGRQTAAIALAVVSTKPPGHFSSGAGRYFAAMVKRAQTGDLHLDRSLWKLRREHRQAETIIASPGLASSSARTRSRWAGGERSSAVRM